MGRLWDIVQAHIDEQPYGASLRSVAGKLKMSPTALGNWRNPRKLPDPENLHALATLTGTPYLRVLDAALEDAGYLPKVGGERARSAPSTQAGESPAPGDIPVEEVNDDVLTLDQLDAPRRTRVDPGRRGDTRG